MEDEAAEQAPLNVETEVTETTLDGSYEWPVVHYEVPPYRTYHFFQQFRSSPSPSNANNFLKGVKWSPDGSCFLTCADDNTFHVFTLPYDDNGNLVNTSATATDADSYAANIVITEGESVYDYCWYPHMTASNPDLCVYATTTRDHPIHLWDANSGQLRCTYRAYNAMDDITAAFSIGFNPDGNKIYAGYNKTIRIFEVHRPGRDFDQHSTVLGNKEGQSGIISSIAFSPAYSGMLAAGSYSQTTAIYREDNMELLYVLHGQEGGVTHVQFSKDGNYLYTGGRKETCLVLGRNTPYAILIMKLNKNPFSKGKWNVPFIGTKGDPYVMCWDIRRTVDAVYKLYRSTESTNQKIQFDIEPLGRYLGTGGQDGLVHIYDLQTGQWVSSFQAALDTISGFSFHPILPMAATASGHRRFGALDVDDSQENMTRTGDENCVSVWSFFSSMGDSTVGGDSG